MTAITRDINYATASSTAKFRAWVQATRQGFLDCGLVKTTDTGQYDTAAGSYSTTANTSWGYDIFRLNDALQNTRPVFIKVEYGNGANSTYPAIWITIGSATDGAGTLISGLVSPRRQIAPNSGIGTAPDVPIPVYFSGDGSYLNYLVPGNNLNWLFSIERTRNADGTANGDGVISVTRSNVDPAWRAHYINWLNQNTSENVDHAAIPGAGFGSTAAGGDVFYFPRLVMLPKLEFDLSMMFAYTNDVANLTQYSFTHLGAPHTYLAWTGAGTPLGAAGGNFSPLLRFE